MAGAPDADERCSEIVADCWDRLARGEPFDEDSVLAAHPDLADELRRRFRALRRVEHAYRGTGGDAAAPSLAGRSLGDYRIESELGTGGMGTVFLACVTRRDASQEDAQSRVALKLIHAHLLARPGFFKRFLREAEIGKRVRHENVVATLDADAVELDGRIHHFLVMEYVEGQTLRALLSELDRVPEELCRHIGREVARGLAAIHAAGAIHRDLKPENVLITKSNTVKVMDLGVARTDDDALRLSQTGVFVGSVRYAAPEQFGGPAPRSREGAAQSAKGIDAVDGRADLYALGLLLYELSTAAHPFDDDDFHTVLNRQLKEVPRPVGERNPQLSAFFEEVVRTLLAKDRGERIQSAAELAQILDEGERSAWWKARAKALRVETRRPLRRIRIPRETAVYGRDAELSRLRALFERAVAGEGQLVLVEGEAGIGKSRLIDEFAGLLHQESRDFNFLFGSYPPGGAATTSGAFSTAFREHFGDEGLEEALRAALPQTPVLVPAFAALLRGDSAPTGAEPLTKDSLQTVFVHATRALAAERPTIVLIDDLHFAPEEGRALFAALALAVPGHRILLIGTARPGIDEKWLSNLDRVGAARMPLPRLSPKDLARLLVDAFRSERLAEELSFKIAAKSDGNPYFVFEILRGLREGQFIAQRPDGTWVTTQVIRDIQIPSSVLDLVQARVADLDPSERNLLDVASCLGFEFDPALVGAVLGMPPIPTLQAFARIEKKHRLVRSAGRHYVFDHHQVQESLYGGLFEQLREQYHAGIGDVLEAQSGAAAREPKEIDGAVCVALAEHLLLGGRGSIALRYLDAALKHLERNYLYDAASRLAERALSSSGLVNGPLRITLLIRKADHLEILGRSDAQRAVLEDALARADEAADSILRARVLAKLGGHLSRVARYDAAAECLRESREIALAAGDRWIEASVTGILGNLARIAGRLAEAQARHERHLALCRELGNRRGEGVATGNLGNVLADMGRLAEAREHHERNLEIAREIGDRLGETSASGNLALVLHELGLLAEAAEWYRLSLSLARDIGYPLGESLGVGNLGNVHWQAGRYREACECHERSLQLAQEIGDRQGESRSLGNLGLTLNSLGAFEQARARNDESLSLARAIRATRLEAAALGNLGVVDQSMGCLAAALEHLSQHLALARSSGDLTGEARAAGNLGIVLLSLGRRSEARESLDRCVTLARQTGGRIQEACALQSLAELAGEEGDNNGADRLLSDALVRRRAGGSIVGEAETLGELGSLRLRQGRVDEARASLERVREIASELAIGDMILLSTARLAQLPDAEPRDTPASALAALAAHEMQSRFQVRMEARFLLWRATAESAHLAEARRLLHHLVAHAPPDCRESMISNVRLHREIAAAAEHLR